MVGVEDVDDELEGDIKSEAAKSGGVESVLIYPELPEVRATNDPFYLINPIFLTSFTLPLSH